MRQAEARNPFTRMMQNTSATLSPIKAVGLSYLFNTGEGIQRGRGGTVQWIYCPLGMLASVTEVCGQAEPMYSRLSAKFIIGKMFNSRFVECIETLATIATIC